MQSYSFVRFGHYRYINNTVWFITEKIFEFIFHFIGYLDFCEIYNNGSNYLTLFQSQNPGGRNPRISGN